MACEPEHWVLDTNAVLDWLVFDDAPMQTAAALLRAGRARWIHTRAMLDELADVLTREPVTRRARACSEALLRRAEQAAAAHGLLLPAAPRGPWACSDPDDQMFIDLALQARASVLLTRDKALLELARRVDGTGLRILRPAAFAAAQACAR